MAILIKFEIFATIVGAKSPMQAKITPEFYAVIAEDRPPGQANFSPEIFASIIPSPKVFTQAKASTDRRVANFEQATANILRKVGKTEFFRADSLRVVKKIETVHGDTSRKIGITSIKGDTCRQVKNISKTKADTLRKTGIKEKISVATSRVIKIFEKVHGDTSRVFGTIETVNADTCRKLIEKISADTCRKIVIFEKTFADTVIRIPHKLNYFAQPVKKKSAKAIKMLADSAAQSLVNTFKNCNVISFSITLSEKTLSDVFNFESAYNFDINDAITGQLLDYQFNFLIEEINKQGIIQTVKGMYNQDEILYERLRTASSTITRRQKKKKTGYSRTYTSTSITHFSAGCILDSLSYQMGLTANMKFDDFIPYNITADSNTTYASYLSSLFGWSSKVPQRQINVFIRGGVLHVIQRGCEETVFDITDLPHSQPTVNKKMIRTMWQSGDYERDIDDGDDPTGGEWSEEEITRPFSGTISFGDGNSYTRLKYSNGLLVSEYSSTSSDKQNSYTKTTYGYTRLVPEGYQYIAGSIYDNYLVGDYYLETKSTDSYSYIYGDKTEYITVYGQSGSREDEFTVRNDRKIFSVSTTTYKYAWTEADDCYLTEERKKNGRKEYEYKKQEQKNKKNQVVGVTATWELKNSESHLRQTFHVPIGNGWYGQSVYVDGDAQGSNVSQGKPGNKISQYTINEVRKTFTYATITSDPDKAPDNPGGNNGDKDPIEEMEKEYKKMRAKLAPTADITFPVREFEMIFELTRALIWLNRKTQEEISVDIIDKIVGGVPTINHIIDFTERIGFNGNEYYLVSNQIKLTPRKLIQSLKLVRWY